MIKMMIVLLTWSSLIYAEAIQANVTAVSTSGSVGTYTFSVTLKSDETGCEQYADWWEVLSEEGELLYRRILVHSHPTTQPFTRSGGKVAVKADEVVYVRAHMNVLGYVGAVMKGSVSKGFKAVTDLPKFSEKLETQSPLPKGCLF
jgi:hypothetical protein